MARMTLGARLVTGLAGVALLAGAASVGTAPVAAAEVKTGKGQYTDAQPYKGNPDQKDWLGSYVVGDKQVWCVQYAYLAPDTDEQYKPGMVLKTKWGDELAPQVAANISYLLLRYTKTQDDDEAAALAHLLHSWTAGSKNPAQLDPSNDFRSIAYDIAFHEQRLTPGALAATNRLREDATANHGPWTATLTKPEKPQVIGTPDTWTIDVRGAGGKGVKQVPVAVKLTDATVDGKTELTGKTAEDGSPLALKVVPTGPNPSVSFSLDSPADKPVVQEAVQANTQRVVSTGGEKELKGGDKTTAVTAPGTVAVAKIDEKTGQGIQGVALRLTAQDKTSPATGQDGKPLVGADGKPVVVTTGQDGKATVSNLRTPQSVCVIETAAPPGYEQAFDPGAPPSVCGELKPGDTLALVVANRPNKPTVPKTIPAGGAPLAGTGGDGGGGLPNGLLIAAGALVLVGAASGGLIGGLRLRTRRRTVVSRGMREDWGR